MSAIAAGLQWLDATLTGDATYMSYLPGGVNRSQAPVGTPYPLGIIHPQSLMDKNSATAKRIYSPDLFAVKAVGPQSIFSTLNSAADRATVLLNAVNVVVAQGTILGCYRESEIYYIENIAGVEYVHMGGLYRLLIK